jgi:hypothetical protein
MKLVVKHENNDRDFFNELLYISAKWPNLIKNPTTKVHSITKVFSVYLIIGLIMLIGFILLYLNITKWIFLVIIFFMSIYFFISLYFLLDTLRYINKELKDETDSDLTINTSGVRLTRGKKIDYKIDYKDIMYVLINNHSIVFLPKEKSKLMIGLSSKYKDEIIKEFKKMNKDELIIDNSDQYK